MDSALIAGMVRRHEREEGLLVLWPRHGMRWLRVQEVPCVEEATMSSDMRSSGKSNITSPSVCLVAPANCTERLFINRKVYKQVLSIDIRKEK